MDSQTALSAERGEQMGWAADQIGVRLEVVKRSDNVKPFQVLSRRWMIKRALAWLGRCRRLARDFEWPTTHAEAMIHRRHDRG